MNGNIIKLGSDIDTDQIIPSQYLLLPSIEEMKSFAFEPLIPDFPTRVITHPILVADENFGCGSSREQAPSVLKALGVKVIIAKSFARIFFRNAINIGLPVVVCCEIYEKIQADDFIDVHLQQGTILCKRTNEQFHCTKLPAHMMEILNANGLISLLNLKEGVTNHGNDHQ